MARSLKYGCTGDVYKRQIKKYISLDWMISLQENDIELVDKEFITDQFETYESDLVYRVNTEAGSTYLFFFD